MDKVPTRSMDLDIHITPIPQHSEELNALLFALNRVGVYSTSDGRLATEKLWRAGEGGAGQTHYFYGFILLYADTSLEVAHSLISEAILEVLPGRDITTRWSSGRCCEYEGHTKGASVEAKP